MVEPAPIIEPEPLTLPGVTNSRFSTAESKLPITELLSFIEFFAFNVRVAVIGAVLYSLISV